MLRTLGRVACIGVAAALVGGALFFFVERASGTIAGGDGPGFRGRHAGRWEEAADRPAVRGGERGERGSPWTRPEDGTSGQAARPRRGERGNHGEFSPVRGIGGLGVTVAQVGLVVAVVAGLQKRARRQRARAGSPS
jgi:hypothetical protein